MNYPVKTLDQLSLLLKSFRKAKGLTQIDMAGRLGITQQGYAHLESNPAGATLERLFIVLRLLDVEIDLSQTSLTNDKHAESPGKEGDRMKRRALASDELKRPVLAKARVIATPTKKRESW